jgi:hypothetical protein
MGACPHRFIYDKLSRRIFDTTSKISINFLNLLTQINQAMRSTTHRIHAIVFVIIASLSNCDQKSIEQSDDQEIFFEVSYTNQAWVDQFKGFVIDKEGRIKTYNNPPKWYKAAEVTELKPAQITENISQTIVSPVRVPDLKNFASKIDSIKGSEFSRPVSGGADRGITLFYAYRYDQKKQVYTPVLLSQTGNIETHRTDPSAMEISAWLTGILAKVN